MVKINVPKVVLAGVVGTSVMTALMLMAPLMGLPPMNIGQMLGSIMGGSTVAGWMAHFVIGTMLAGIYAVFFVQRLPGVPAVRGAIFALLPWLVAQVAVMPMMGAGLFSGSMIAAGASLIGHIVYGAAVGAAYGKGELGVSHPTAQHHAHA